MCNHDTLAEGNQSSVNVPYRKTNLDQTRGQMENFVHMFGGKVINFYLVPHELFEFFVGGTW